MASALVSVTWLRQQMANGLKNIRILDGKVRFCVVKDKRPVLPSRPELPPFTLSSSFNLNDTPHTNS